MTEKERETKLVTTADIASYYNVNRATVWRWRQEGLPTEISKPPRFNWDKVQAWIKEHKS